MREKDILHDCFSTLSKIRNVFRSRIREFKSCVSKAWSVKQILTMASLVVQNKRVKWKTNMTE